MELITSDYAAEEAFRNLPTPDRRERLTRFLANISIITEWHQATIPDNIELREKDVPILQAAIASRANHLITGDKQDFGTYFDQTFEGITILLPATYLRDRS